MSAPSALAFIGLRFQIDDDDEIEQLEERAARNTREASLSGFRWRSPVVLPIDARRVTTAASIDVASGRGHQSRRNAGRASILAAGAESVATRSRVVRSPVCRQAGGICWAVRARGFGEGWIVCHGAAPRRPVFLAEAQRAQRFFLE